MSRYATAYAKPKGPGDLRPTALQIVEDEGLVDKLTDKVALVTGANSGIGLETARALHAAGTTLFITARDSTKAQKAIDDVLGSDGGKSGAPIHALELRLDSLKSVRAAAKAFLEKTSKLNLLILNAGIMCTPEGKTEDGFELQFGTNHLGHFLLFQLLKPALLAGTAPSFHSRVVAISSIAHNDSGIRFHDINFEKEPYNPWIAYGQSKTANIYFANEVERRYGSEGLHALSLHPGVIFTNLTNHMDTTAWVASMTEDDKNALKSVPQGAATTIYAALSEDWEGRGGKYLNNCAVDPPIPVGKKWQEGASGHAAWAYDEESASKLWDKSNELVGFEEE
ncbi:short-chain dehydrogenase/reductase ATR7 [Colletotrichum spaethianum]|uniref:Short-chain dehydrogenase/reductase ATR7 n=1 Tax=Colletotrichum spaethianum TaxID=700344 RepID=A0AA37LF18_9PEZI|nr:short-chain dehydrogenase/reductase ATR7 [Colletotrichum spaethianum]GKT44770.1 short-chain dehydrogenase/reductase ATR7 [Colletotrichum spaethianum]